MVMIYRKPAGCIYVATCIHNGKKYVGKAAGRMKRRKLWHERQSKNPRLVFHLALRKHGLSAFTWEEIYHSNDNSQLCEAEISYICCWKTRSPLGYNLTDGGDGGATVTGRKMPLSDEHKRKLSIAHKGKKLSEEHRKKLSLVRTGKVRGPHKKSTLEKISKALTGKPLSQEHKEKLRITSTGRTQSELTRKKKSESLKKYHIEHPGMGLGRKHTEETRLRVSRAKFEYWARRKERENNVS